MKILFLTDNFPPEVNAPARRTYEHCTEWVRQGEDVTVLTCQPNFPQGKIYDGYKNRLRQVESIDGIRVIRLWSYMSQNTGFVRRSMDFGSYAVMASLFGWMEKADVIVATSPQFFTTWAGWFLSKVKRIPWVFELRDLWPKSIATVGSLDQESRLYRFLETVELSLYHSSDLVIPNTHAFKKNLTQRGIDGEKISVVPNGALLEEYKNIERGGELLSELGIRADFIVGYIGTHGMAHSLDFVIQSIINHRQELDGVHFLFVGDGSEKESVVQMAHSVELDNVTFCDPVPKEEIPRFLAAIDASLVPLRKSDTFKTVIPSKIFEASAMGLPILLGVEGQAKELVDKYESGLSFEPENSVDFVRTVRLLKEDRDLYARLSENSLKLAQAYDRNVLANKMLEELHRLVS